MCKYQLRLMLLLAGAAFLNMRAAPDMITVHNNTNRAVYAAIYYVPEQVALPTVLADRHGTVTLIPKKSSQKIERPGRRYQMLGLYDRDLYIADSCAALAPKLSVGSLPRVNVGSLRGHTFYIDDVGGKLTGFNALTWVAYTLHFSIAAGSNFLLEEVQSEYSDHPYSNQEAVVRHGTDLAVEEQAYIKERLVVVKKTCETLLATTVADDAVPRVALCTSGGGYRAMISTLGFLQGAQRAGYYDLFCYHSALSGSSWCLGGLMHSGLSAKKYQERLSEYLTTSFLRDNDNNQVTRALLKQYAFTDQVSLIDFYGALLAQKLLRVVAPNPHDLTLSQQIDMVQPSKNPFPLYAGIIDQNDSGVYSWVEFTPYEVGCPDMRSSVPSWAFGRTFYEGRTQDFDPPQSLGFCMGIWGSGMSVNMRELLVDYKDRINSSIIISKLVAIVENSSVSTSRVYPAKIANWTLGTQLPMHECEKLTLIDAGIDCALPFPPILRPERGIDIIVVLDASRDRAWLHALLRSAEYARERGLKFPPIDTAKATSSVCSVHEDPTDPTVPTIIYIPLLKQATYQHGWDPGLADFTATLNFKYTQEQLSLLSGLTEQAALMSNDMILAAVKKCIEKKKNKGSVVCA